MTFLLHHAGWLVACALTLVYVVFPSWGGKRVSALDKTRRDARGRRP